MSLTTKQDWITALTKAKKEALRLWPDILCIHDACFDNGLRWNVNQNVIFDHDDTSVGFMNTNPTRAQVAAVFDRSIAAIKEM